MSEQRISGIGKNVSASRKKQAEALASLSVPCAAYLVQNDTELTVLWGNSAFYGLFKCTEEEMQFKYGNRLSGLIVPKSIKAFGEATQNAVEGERFVLKQQIKRGSVEAWIHTEAVLTQYEGGPAFSCVSFDITGNALEEQALTLYEDMVQLIARQGGMDVFRYDPETRSARVYVGQFILQEWAAVKNSEIADFPAVMCKLVHPEDVPAFFRVFNDARQNGGKGTSELRIKNPSGQYGWIRFTMDAAHRLPGMERWITGLLEDITQEKEASLDYLSETQFYQAMLSETTAYGQADITEDRVTRVGGMWNLYNEVIARVSYSKIITEFINKVVHPEDRGHYLELMQRSNLMESLENGVDRLGCKFRRIVEQNKMMWMELSVHLFRNPLANHVMALLYLKNTDPPKSRESVLLPEKDRGQGSEVPTQLSISLLSDEESRQGDAFDVFVGEQGDMAYLVDPETFDLICGNQAFYDRLGMTREDCCGMKCYEAVHKRQAPCPFCGKANWTTDKFYMWKNLNTALEQEFLIKNKLVQWKGSEVLLALCVDISNNKSIVDSMENGATESHSLLSGVQRMAEAADLSTAVTLALETIGYFFRAGSVRFWRREQGETYICAYTWLKEPVEELEQDTLREVNQWLQCQKWEHPILLENPEAMLCYSYGMYQYMKRNKIRNQRWLRVEDGGKELGCISISNISSNFQNVAFMESFSVFIASEIKKRSLMEEAIYANFHDDLTDLLSRYSFETYLAGYHGDEVSSVGVMMANLNNLKEINSTRGFYMGNHYIKQFAGMLRETFVDDAIFRLNGDEFLAIATDIERPILEDKIRRLEQMIRKYGTFTVSIGYSWDNVENDLAVLIEQSTQAMKVNKKRHYDSIPISVDVERRKMLSELITALEAGAFHVYLQPKVELLHRKVIGAEALIRYQSEELGVVLPNKFIDVLEKNNFIRYIDLFVFEEVCKLLEKWKKQNLPLPVISLNFSRMTLLERDILSNMETIIAKYDVSRRNIEIEITESFANMGKSILYQAARDLYQAGFSISLDDFGTKYTNLSILADINFNVLKLDKSLISALVRQHSNQIILKNIIIMCNDLDIEVIAEGVETQAQEKILREMKCKLGQGYLYGKPMPIDEFEGKYILK